MDATAEGIVGGWIAIWVVVWAACAIVTGIIAKSRGRDAILWGLYGLAIPIVAIPHAIVVQPNLPGLGKAPCPFCREATAKDATVCPHCGSSLSSSPRRGTARTCPQCGTIARHDKPFCTQCGEKL